MDQVNRVMFPLRSNAGWFESEDLKSSLIDQLKYAFLLYDEVLIEDGTYELDMTERGGSSFWHPSGSLPKEQRKIIVERDLAATDLSLSVKEEGSSDPSKPIVHGPTIARLKIDYFDILREVDLSDASFVRFVQLPDHEIPAEMHAEIMRASWRDTPLVKDIVPNQHLRSTLVKSLNRDLAISVLTGSAIVLDPSQYGLLQRKVSATPSFSLTLKDPQVAAGERIIHLITPSLEGLDLQETIKLRQNKSWRSFREFIRAVGSEVALTDKPISREQLHECVRSRVERAVFNEVLGAQGTQTGAIIDLALGAASFVPEPVVSLSAAGLGYAKTIWQKLQRRGHWVAFLQKLRKKVGNGTPN